jgi:sugar phosphate isomerase/epimerase
MIHLKDCRLDANEVKSMGCGLGDMDYTQIVKFALERKDHIHATLEDTKPDSAEVSRRCIEGYENKILGK